MYKGVFCNEKVTMPSLQFAGLASAKSTTCSSLWRVCSFVRSDLRQKLVTFARVWPRAEVQDVSSASLHALEEACGFFGQPSLCHFEGPCSAESACLHTLIRRPWGWASRCRGPHSTAAILPWVLGADICTSTRAWQWEIPICMIKESLTSERDWFCLPSKRFLK